MNVKTIGKNIAKATGATAFGSTLAIGVTMGVKHLQVRFESDEALTFIDQHPMNRHNFCDISLENRLQSLTLLGEVHVYTQNEIFTSEQMLTEYDMVLMEGCGGCFSQFSAWERFALYGRDMNHYYNGLATGIDQDNLTMEKLAIQHKIPILYTEWNTKGGFDVISETDRHDLFLGFLLDFITASSGFSWGMREVDAYDPQVRDYSESNDRLAVHERNVLMTDQIRRYMDEYGAGRYLAVVGLAHYYEMKELLGGCTEEYFKLPPR